MGEPPSSSPGGGGINLSRQPARVPAATASHTTNPPPNPRAVGDPAACRIRLTFSWLGAEGESLCTARTETVYGQVLALRPAASTARGPGGRDGEVGPQAQRLAVTKQARHRRIARIHLLARWYAA